MIEGLISLNTGRLEMIYQLRDEVEGLAGRLRRGRAGKEAPPVPEYKACLVLEGCLPEPLYKGKSFDIRLAVHRLTPAPQPHYLQLFVELLTESRELQIVHNLKGQPVVSFSPESRIVGDQGVLRKVRINEVTSKFKRGAVTLCIRAEAPFLNSFEEADSNPIEPLYISNVKVYSRPNKQ